MQASHAKFTRNRYILSELCIFADPPDTHPCRADVNLGECASPMLCMQLSAT
jgi:hypothetical protein